MMLLILIKIGKLAPILLFSSIWQYISVTIHFLNFYFHTSTCLCYKCVVWKFCTPISFHTGNWKWKFTYSSSFVKYAKNEPKKGDFVLFNRKIIYIHNACLLFLPAWWAWDLGCYNSLKMMFLFDFIFWCLMIQVELTCMKMWYQRQRQRATLSKRFESWSMHYYILLHFMQIQPVIQNQFNNISI